MSIEITNHKIEQYLEQLLPTREPWFLEMEELARKKNFPAVGPQVGTLLELMARSIKAERIMEMGSGYGYSGLWFAKALPKDGYLLLTDFEEENRKQAEKYFHMAGQTHLMEFKTGDALSLLAEEKEPFDIIFNDIDKELYPAVIDPVHRLLRPGGLFITDNTLWEGNLVQDPGTDDAPSAAVRLFNEKLKNHPGFLTSWLPLRDGISISSKR